MIVIAPLLLMMILGIAALALDSGNLYFTYAKLQSAADAGTLFASSMMIAGESNVPDFGQKAAAVSLSANSLNSNYVKVNSVVQDGTLVKTRLRYQKNLWLAQVMRGFGTDTDVEVSSSTNPPPIYVALVLDVSGSMNCPEKDLICGCDITSTKPFDPTCVGSDCSCNPDGSKVRKLKQAAEHFVNQFSETKDKVAIVTYALYANILHPFDQAPGFKKADVLAAIDSIKADGATNASDGIKSAHQLFSDINKVSPIPGNALKAMVLFSDGAQTAARFKVNPDEVLALTPNPGGTEYDYYSMHKLEKQVKTWKQMFGSPIPPDTAPGVPPDWDAAYLNQQMVIAQFNFTHPLIKAPINLDSNGTEIFFKPQCYEVQRVDTPAPFAPILTHFYLDRYNAPYSLWGATGACTLDLWDLWGNRCLFRTKDAKRQCLEYVNGKSPADIGMAGVQPSLSDAEYKEQWPNILSSWLYWCDSFWSSEYIREGRRRAGLVATVPSWSKWYKDNGMAAPWFFNDAGISPLYDNQFSSASWKGATAVSPSPFVYDLCYLQSSLANYKNIPPTDASDFLNSMEGIFSQQIAKFVAGGDGLWVSQYIQNSFITNYLDKINGLKHYDNKLVGDPTRSATEIAQLRLTYSLYYYDQFFVYWHNYFGERFTQLNDAFNDYWTWWRKGTAPQETECVYSVGMLHPDPGMKGTPFEVLNRSAPPGPRSMYRQYHNVAIAEADYARREGITVYSIGLGQPAAAGKDPYQDVLEYDLIKEYFLRRIALDVNSENDPQFQGVPSYAEISNSYQTILKNGCYKHVLFAQELDEVFNKIAGEIKMKLIS